MRAHRPPTPPGSAVPHRRGARTWPWLPACLDVLGAAGLLQRRLRRREACERDAIGRAAHVVEPDPMAELHRRRLAAVLTADAELDLRLRLPAPPHRDPHQVADTVLVEHLERVALEHA